MNEKPVYRPSLAAIIAGLIGWALIGATVWWLW
jgi:hypothetical protein